MKYEHKWHQKIRDPYLGLAPFSYLEKYQWVKTYKIIAVSLQKLSSYQKQQKVHFAGSRESRKTVFNKLMIEVPK